MTLEQVQSMLDLQHLHLLVFYLLWHVDQFGPFLSTFCNCKKCLILGGFEEWVEIYFIQYLNKNVEILSIFFSKDAVPPEAPIDASIWKYSVSKLLFICLLLIYLFLFCFLLLRVGSCFNYLAILISQIKFQAKVCQVLRLEEQKNITRTLYHQMHVRIYCADCMLKMLDNQDLLFHPFQYHFQNAWSISCYHP